MDFIVFASLPASDLDRARSWYEAKLGLTPESESQEGTLIYMQSESSGFMVYASEFAGTNQATSAGLAVADVEATVAELRARGVIFEEYDMGEDFRTVDGIVTSADGRKAAWFKDSEGNILGLGEDPRT
jgi:predicted enzyme related to lactoylglutathione lyase